MRRSFRLRPTAGQQVALTGMLGDHRDLYNAALQERRDAWRVRHGSVRYGQPGSEGIRAADPPGQGRWSFSCQQATLRRLDKAFAAFCRRVKNGQVPGYPRFKGAVSVTWPTDGDGARWNSVPHPTLARVYLQGVGQVKVHAHRAVLGRVRTITVQRQGRRWSVTLSCDGVPAAPLPPTGAVVGVDVGVAWFHTTSDGAHVPNPRPLAASADRLAAAQAALARTRRRSARRRRAVQRVAAVHATVVRQRLDHAHKVTLALVRGCDLRAVEALHVTNLTRRALPRPDPDTRGAYLPNRAGAKTGLNRSILDAGWGVFLTILTAKAESAGRTVLAMNPRDTSRTCPSCGHVAAGNRATQAVFLCLSCGYADHAGHADQVAARNIVRAGLARRAAQAAKREAAVLRQRRSHDLQEDAVARVEPGTSGAVDGDVDLLALVEEGGLAGVEDGSAVDVDGTGAVPHDAEAVGVDDGAAGPQRGQLRGREAQVQFGVEGGDGLRCAVAVVEVVLSP